MSAKPELQGSGVVPTGNRRAKPAAGRDEIVALKRPFAGCGKLGRTTRIQAMAKYRGGDNR